ncbi:DNA cytosine methyltransferase [Caulobacter sp. FWC2]|uniref:DNA cytosine methyltransferase n=1 Tax=Caulobacter sp. FWC2 TaxID=69664 RepID=UPI000C14EFDD|nr:DNA cytosine methyltransferase [Caulobacter sp. FWC2]PIB91248.1 DNA (cytosine-5-)-methyltransferase [Caulobacter sp. FWC2]
MGEKTFTYGSVCSGIEAATVAWHPLGWKPAFFSEIDAFPRAVLAHHYPDVPLHGDFTTIQDGDYDPIDLLVGGTPCQGLSVAGRRGGLRDDRSVLALEYSLLADRLRPRWLAWENVPGAFTTRDDEDDDAIPGEDFAAFLSTLVRWSVQVPEGSFKNSGVLASGPVDGAYGVAWRVLDAQFAGVPQRRRRIFVVGHLGDWRPAAAVLFERESLSRCFAPSRDEGSRVAHTLTRGAESSGKGGYAGRRQEDDFNLIPVAFGGNNTAGPIDVATAVTAHGGPHGRLDFDSETFIVQAFDRRGREGGAQLEGPHDSANIRAATGGSSSSYLAFFTKLWWAIRRLTPLEKERLQGFPDQYTNIIWNGRKASDGARGKALGNSMAVPVMTWIGQRIAAVEAMLETMRAAA